MFFMGRERRESMTFKSRRAFRPRGKGCRAKESAWNLTKVRFACARRSLMPLVESKPQVLDLDLVRIVDSGGAAGTASGHWRGGSSIWNRARLRT